MKLKSSFKTLVYKNPIDPEMPFGHVTFMDKHVMSGSVPQMIVAKQSIERLALTFPNVDFSEVDLIPINIQYKQ